MAFIVDPALKGRSFISCGAPFAWIWNLWITKVARRGPGKITDKPAHLANGNRISTMKIQREEANEVRANVRNILSLERSASRGINNAARLNGWSDWNHFIFARINSGEKWSRIGARISSRAKTGGIKFRSVH